MDENQDALSVRWSVDRYGCLHLAPLDESFRRALDGFLTEMGAPREDGTVFVQEDFARRHLVEDELTAEQYDTLERFGDVEVQMEPYTFLRLVGHDAAEEFNYEPIDSHT